MKKTLLTPLCITLIMAMCSTSLYAQRESEQLPGKTHIFNGSSRGDNSILLYSTAQTDANPGVYSTTLANYNQGTKISTITQSYQAMEAVEGIVYVITYNAGPETNSFGMLNPTTGDFTLISPSTAPDACSMAWNPIDNTVYATIFGSSSSSPFGTINLASGTFSLIGTVPGIFYIAIDNEGVCYAFDSGNNRFGTLNLQNGVFTQIKSYTDNYNFIQDILIDHETNELYHNARIDPDRTSLWNKINKTTGDITPIGSFGKHVESIVLLSGISQPECEPATNLQIEYDSECSHANLTWNAPEEGNFSYKVYRDGDPIATVTTETFIDSDFEPTLDHTWAIQVVCDETSSPLLYGYKENCTIAACPQRPKNFTVLYNDKCEANLTWNAPADVLFESIFDPDDDGFYHGYSSSRWMMEEPESYQIQADDFEVPAGETWVVTEVFIYGFVSSGDEAPDFIGIEIYFDRGDDVPGDIIYENPYLTPLSGSISGRNNMILDRPVELSEGRYWISFYGTYDKEYTQTRRYSAVFDPSIIYGSPVAFLNGAVGDWEPYFQDAGSLYFRVQGSKGSPILYNIYRDTQPIAEGVKETSFIDNTFDPEVAHKWTVKVICPEGESAAALINLPKCKAGSDVNDMIALSFFVAPNPANDKITINANSVFNTIEVINFLGQTVMSQPNAYNNASLDISNLNSGVYFIRIISNNGSSVQKFVKQ